MAAFHEKMYTARLQKTDPNTQLLVILPDKNQPRAIYSWVGPLSIMLCETSRPLRISRYPFLAGTAGRFSEPTQLRKQAVPNGKLRKGGPVPFPFQPLVVPTSDDPIATGRTINGTGMSEPKIR